MRKNTASQKWRVFAFSLADGAPVTGDAANITAKLSIDYGTATALTDTNPAETEDGYYLFDLTQAETNGDDLSIYPQSSTTDVVVIGCPENHVTVDPSAVVTELMDTADSIEVGLTFREAQRLSLAALAGKVSGGGTSTMVYRNAVADSANRITATVDENGNRSAITVVLA